MTRPAGITQGEIDRAIMAIHGHTSAKNSEVYTRGAERWRLARDAMATMKRMEW